MSLPSSFKGYKSRGKVGYVQFSMKKAASNKLNQRKMLSNHRKVLPSDKNSSSKEE